MSLQININFELILVLNQNQLLFHLSFFPGESWAGLAQTFVPPEDGSN